MTYEDRYLVVSTPFDMAARLDRLAAVNYISDPDEWLVLLRTAGLWRALFPVGDGETDAAALSDRSARRRLGGIVATAEPFEVVHRTIYRVHQRVAERFLVGRVVLMGDAAHITTAGGHGNERGHPRRGAAGRILAAVLRGDIGADRLAPAQPRSAAGWPSSTSGGTPTRTPRAWPPPTVPPASARWTGWPPGRPIQPKPGPTCFRPR